jgi:hypothetical protein
MCFQKWRKLLVFSKILKNLLKTKGRISFRGNFVVVKGKAFETVGEISKS